MWQEICRQRCAGCAQALGAAERGDQAMVPALAALLDPAGGRAHRLPGAGEAPQGRGTRTTGRRAVLAPPGRSPGSPPRRGDV